MNSVIEQLKQVRNVETLAEQIEPLAVSMATLADDLRTTNEEAKKSIQEVSESQGQKIAKMSNLLDQQAKNLEVKFQQLEKLSEGIHKRHKLVTLKYSALMLSVSVILAVAINAFLIYNLPQMMKTKQADRQQKTGELFENSLASLPKNERQKVLKILGLAETK